MTILKDRTAIPKVSFERARAAWNDCPVSSGTLNRLTKLATIIPRNLELFPFAGSPFLPPRSKKTVQSRLSDHNNTQIKPGFSPPQTVRRSLLFLLVEPSKPHRPVIRRSITIPGSLRSLSSRSSVDLLKLGRVETPKKMDTND
jgi:hypothetical protein